MTNPANRTLLGVGFFSSAIVALFMSQTLYGLMSANNLSFLGLLMGLILEAFRVAACYTAAFDYWPNRRYGALAISAAMVAAITLVSVWAGNERLIHSVAADEKHVQAQRGTRSDQITAELASIDAQLADLAKPYLVTADTKHEREMLKELQAQAKSMRDRMALTKAAELESGPIANLLATIERKEDSVAAANREEAGRRHALERDLRASRTALNQEQVEIASLASKIESTDRATTDRVLRIIALVFEAIPLFVFFFCEKPSVAAAMARKAEVTQEEGSEPIAQEPRQIAPQVAPQAAPVATVASISHSAEMIEDSAEEPIQIAPQSTPVTIAEQVHEEPAAEAPVASADDSEVAVETTAAMGVDALPAFNHPQLDQVSAQVKALKSGESVSQDWLKKTFKLGGDTAKRFTDYLGEIGLITKTSRGWVRS